MITSFRHSKICKHGTPSPEMHVNRIYRQPMKWWNPDRTQQARRSLREWPISEFWFASASKREWKCVSPTISFLCRSNSFSYEKFCRKTCFATEANQNSEMGYSKAIIVWQSRSNYKVSERSQWGNNTVEFRVPCTFEDWSKQDPGHRRPSFSFCFSAKFDSCRLHRPRLRIPRCEGTFLSFLSSLNSFHDHSVVNFKLRRGITPMEEPWSEITCKQKMLMRFS